METKSKKNINIKEYINKLKNIHTLIIVNILFSIYITINIVMIATTYESSLTMDMNVFNVGQELIAENLGKLLAFIGFIGTFFIYMITHKPAVLFFGITVSLIAGGLVGISTIFFNAGTASFVM